MGKEGQAVSKTGASVKASVAESHVKVLAVGDPEEWVKRGNRIPIDSSVAFVAFSEVSGCLMERIGPALILSPVLARGFDCIDLAQVLQQMGYGGQYRAIANKLPNPEMVEREIRHLCPGLDFGVLEAA